MYEKKSFLKNIAAGGQRSLRPRKRNFAKVTEKSGGGRVQVRKGKGRPGFSYESGMANDILINVCEKSNSNFRLEISL